MRITPLTPALFREGRGSETARGMNPLENFRMAFESLWQNKLRSFLALLGIVIGVFAVTAMISLGEMASAGITKDLESIAGRSIWIQPDFNTGASFDSAPIRDEDITALQQLPVQVIPQLFQSGEYESKPGERRALTLQGTPGDLPRIDPTTKMARGRYFSVSEGSGGAGGGGGSAPPPHGFVSPQKTPR